MMRFLVFHPEKFKNDNLLLAFSFTFLKYWSAILTELINIMKMGQADNIDDVVKDFIAFGIIVEIDNMILQTISRVEGLSVEEYFEFHAQHQKQSEMVQKVISKVKMSKTYRDEDDDSYQTWTELLL